MSVPEPSAQTAEPAAEYFPAQPSRRMEIIVALVPLAFNIVLLVLAQQIELRKAAEPTAITARWWPTVLAIMGIALSAARLVVVLVRPPDERDDLEAVGRGGPTRLLIALALIIAYVGAWSLRESLVFPLFLVITPLLLAALVWLFGGRGWKALIAYPIGMAAFIYALFGLLLRIPL